MVNGWGWDRLDAPPVLAHEPRLLFPANNTNIAHIKQNYTRAVIRHVSTDGQKDFYNRGKCSAGKTIKDQWSRLIGSLVFQRRIYGAGKILCLVDKCIN